MKKSYAIRISGRLIRPQYIPGYSTKVEAVNALNTITKEKGYQYSVVYVTEYFSPFFDDPSSDPKRTIAECSEPDTKV